MNKDKTQFNGWTPKIMTSKSKIDFVAAMILALADYMSCESGDSVYDTRGVLSF